MCSPWSFTLTVNGTSADNPASLVVEGSDPVYTNPSAGPYLFTATLVSERDADNDGTGNARDICSTTSSTADSDAGGGDGIGDGCDPTPSVDTNDGDHDADGLPNEYDNCPTAANVTQTDADLDDLGAACDASDSAPNGTYHLLYCYDGVGIGTGDPGPPGCSTTPPGPDGDGDGCTDSEELGSDPLLGGGRDPANANDFFDVPMPPGNPGTGARDKFVGVSDVAGLRAKFGSDNNGTPGDFSDDQPLANGQKYNPDFDRTLAGPDPWDTSPGDGSIYIADVALIRAQFGHSCTALP